jgi:predicted DsbA family dithiol-disulfide isomerase
LGLALDMSTIRPVNMRDLHRLSHHAAAAGRMQPFVERAFHAYHIERVNVADAEVLVGLGVSAGLGETAVRAVIASGAHDANVLSDRAEALHLGIHSVPMLRDALGRTASLNAPDLLVLLGSHPRGAGTETLETGDERRTK